MARALEEAVRAGSRGDVPVGAVLVGGSGGSGGSGGLGGSGDIVAVSGNEMRSGSDPTAHAEILVLREGGRILGRENLFGCDLYVTLEPCLMCAVAISLARVRRLYYGAADERFGGVDHGVRYFGTVGCRHVPEVYGGLREVEAARLLKRFFEARR